MIDEQSIEPVLVAPKTVRTTAGLRDTLFNALDGINAKTITAPEAQAISKLAAQITNSINTEIEFYKHIGRHNIDGIGPDTVMRLGTNDAAE